MTSLARIGLVLAVLLVSLPASSLARSASMKQRVASAKQQYISQEYEVVIRLLTPVVQSPIATISAKGMGVPESVKGAAPIPGTGPGMPERLPSELSMPPSALFRAW